MSACKNLDNLLESVESAASKAVDGIVGTITNNPTAGTAAAIGAKISSAINTVKAEAEEAIAAAKGAVANFEKTLMEFAEEAQAQIADIQQQMIGATQEVIAQLQAQIDEIKAEIDSKIPAWMHKTPEELLQDVISGICDPNVDGMVVPEEGTAKTIQPATAPSINPGPSPIETFAAPAKPPINTNPIIPDPETGVTL
jgi:hypothetical protein